MQSPGESGVKGLVGWSEHLLTQQLQISSLLLARLDPAVKLLTFRDTSDTENQKPEH